MKTNLKKNKPMTPDDRIEMQECLNERMTFKDIGDNLYFVIRIVRKIESKRRILDKKQGCRQPDSKKSFCYSPCSSLTDGQKSYFSTKRAAITVISSQAVFSFCCFALASRAEAS